MAFDVSYSFVDRLRAALKRNAQWLDRRPQRIPQITSYASADRYSYRKLPLIAPYISATGGSVNYFGCTPTESFLAVNSQHSKDGSNFLRFGRSAELLGRDEILVDYTSTHELIHIHQNNVAPYKRKALPKADINPDWIIEGIADAVGARRAHVSHGGYPAIMGRIGPRSNGFYRRLYFLRNYNIPLNFSPNLVGTGVKGKKRLAGYSRAEYQVLSQIEMSMLKNLDYETNGFWFHVLDRYLDYNVGGFADLYRRMDTPSLTRLTQQVDSFLDGEDGGAMRGLEHVYPQFLAEFANWWEVRTAKRIGETKWLNVAFNGCRDYSLSATAASKELNIELSEYAGACLDITIDGASAADFTELQLAVRAEDSLADEVYLGMARIRGSREGEQSCFDVVESRGIQTAPCLIDPRQGILHWKHAAQQKPPMLARSFNVGGVRGKQGQDLFMRIILTRVPSSHRDLVGELERRRFSVAVSADYAQLKSKKARDPRSKAVSRYGKRQGEGAAATAGGMAAADANRLDALRGRVNTPFGDTKVSISGTQLSVALESEDGASFLVGFQMKEPLEPGVTGAVEATAIMGATDESGSEVVAYQDPDKKSELNISNHDDLSLTFDGTARLCVLPTSKLLNFADPPTDFCEAGRRESYEISGSVAFPTVLTSSDAYVFQGSEALDAYQDLRLARMGLLPSGGASGGSTSSGPATQSTSSGGNFRGEMAPMGGSCSITNPDGACDCSCESRRCFEKKRDNDALRGQEAACPLTCGKRWRQC
ncbi:MAG: hypothetical protein AAGG55_02815 [Pseudomonadota bacterium]